MKQQLLTHFNDFHIYDNDTNKIQALTNIIERTAQKRTPNDYSPVRGRIQEDGSFTSNNSTFRTSFIPIGNHALITINTANTPIAYCRVYLYDSNQTPLGFMLYYPEPEQSPVPIFTPQRKCILTQVPSNYYMAIWFFLGSGTLSQTRLTTDYSIYTF